MYPMKRVCILLSAAAILTIATGLDLGHRDSLGKTQADGGGPTPPPIPWQATTVDSPRFMADGGGPTPPPIPWGPANTEGKFLRS
jgi:hypothetical protein